MSVNRKIFGLASSVIVFTGMAYGQAALQCNTAGAAGPALVNGVASNGMLATSPSNPIELRSEGATELVSDTITPCLASGVALGINGNVTAFIQGSGVQGITSKALTGSLAGFSDATLAIIDNSGGGNATVYYPGVVSGSQVSFGTTANPVNFPNYKFIIQVSDVRVNVTGTFPSVPQAVTETVFAGTQGVASLFTPTALTVGYIRNGLAVNGIANPVYTGAGSSTAGTAGSVASFPVCTGIANSSSGLAASAGFAVTVSELFAGAFKTGTVTAVNQGGTLLVPASANIPGSESGSLTGAITYQGGASATVGAANSGTRIKFVFNNIPTNATLSVPLTISTGTPTSLTMTLVSSTETGAFAAATATTGYNGNFALTATSGSATAIYEVTLANLTAIKSFTLTPSITFAANTVVAPAGPISVTASYSPSPATPGGTLANPIPTIPYFANTGTVLNGGTFTVCQTTLLFPFVTNQAGFETGIAIANTGLDSLATGGKSTATGQAGACTINFYGSTGAEGGTQPTAPTAANFPSATNKPTTSIAPGATHADTLTDIAGGSFQGYAIAVCPFLYARGFAFIEYGLTTSNGVVEGYLADVINANRTSVVAATTSVNSNSPEVSGH